MCKFKPLKKKKTTNFKGNPQKHRKNRGPNNMRGKFEKKKKIEFQFTYTTFKLVFQNT